jgi:AraC-like DNA-binding protein
MQDLIYRDGKVIARNDIFDRIMDNSLECDKGGFDMLAGDSYRAQLVVNGKVSKADFESWLNPAELYWDAQIALLIGDEEYGKKFAEEIRSGYVLAFFGELLRSMDLYGPDSGELSALKNIVDYCSKNYTKEISLELLSKELHMSKYYISHIFGNRLNMRFNDYINSLRISKACLLLADNDKSITAVSDSVGFSTIRTFNRAFLKQTGRSPSEYRRTIAQVQSLAATGGPVINFVMDKKSEAKPEK